MTTNRKDRIKQQMLRELVRENIAILEGSPYGVRAVRRRGLRVPQAFAILAAGTVAILFASNNPTAASREIRAHVPPPESAFAGEAAPPVDAELPLALPAPRPVSPSVFGLYARKIVIDPGHGGADPGAITPHGIREKDVTLDIGRRLSEILRARHYEVAMTRDRDETVSLQERTTFANQARGDLFVSIHVNSIPRQERRGIETYYVGPADDPHVESLAQAENSNSGYSLADFRRLLEGVYVDIRQEQSHSLAEAVQTRLYGGLHKANPALENRGVKRAPFVVLVATQMPGVLAEVSCVSNAEEARLLAQSDYRGQIARALAAGIEAYSGGSSAPAPQSASATLPRSGI